MRVKGFGFLCMPTGAVSLSQNKKEQHQVNKDAFEQGIFPTHPLFVTGSVCSAVCSRVTHPQSTFLTFSKSKSITFMYNSSCWLLISSLLFFILPSGNLGMYDVGFFIFFNVTSVQFILPELCFPLLQYHRILMYIRHVQR